MKQTDITNVPRPSRAPLMRKAGAACLVLALTLAGLMPLTLTGCGKKTEDGGNPKKATKLLLSDKVAAVFGCWTSASRKSVLKIFEDNNGQLFYPVQYEGNECSKNVVYTGAAPNQQILPAVEWLWKQGYRKFYLL